MIDSKTERRQGTKETSDYQLKQLRRLKVNLKVNRLQHAASGGVTFVALNDAVAERDEPFSATGKSSSTIAAFKQSAVWMREMPGIVRGLLRLYRPFRWHMAAIFAMNLVIASWETCLALVVVATLTAMSPEALTGPFFFIVIGLAYPVFVFNGPTEVILPYLRDLYATKYFKSQVEKELILRGVPSDDTRRMQGHLPELRGNTAPTAREGRSAAYGIVDMLMRDTAYALRGIGVLVFLYLTNPILVMLLFCSMLVDLWITLRMDMRCTPLYQVQKDRNLAMHGFEFKAHEPHVDDLRLNADERWQRKITRNSLVKACDVNIDAFKPAEFSRIHWQYLRSAVSKTFHVAIVVLIAYWVYTGQMSLAQFLIFTSVCTRACEPLTVFLSLQNAIMTNRELLRRLGLVTGVDFGVKPPK